MIRRRKLFIGSLALLACGDTSSWQTNGDLVPDNFTRVSGTREMSVKAVRSRIWPADPVERFRSPGLKQRRAFVELLEAMASRDLGPSLEAAQSLEPKAHAAGFEVERWRLENEEFVALVEPPGLARGSGAYLFRLSEGIGPATAPRRAVILQAPHAFHDEGTGRLATGMFFDERVPKADRPWALFVNNAHRYLDDRGRTRSRDYNPADPCHATEHLFNDATEGMANVGPVVVYQLHGFDDERVEADVIVSSGHPLGSTDASTRVARRMEKSFEERGFGVFRFPEDTGRLGATKNLQARILLAKDDAEFVHVELSAEMRQALLGDAGLISRLARTLFRPLDPETPLTPDMPKAEAESPADPQKTSKTGTFADTPETSQTDTAADEPTTAQEEPEP